MSDSSKKSYSAFYFPLEVRAKKQKSAILHDAQPMKLELEENELSVSATKCWESIILQLSSSFHAI